MYAREDSPEQPTTNRLFDSLTSDGMTLAKSNVRMHERMSQQETERSLSVETEEQLENSARHMKMMLDRSELKETFGSFATRCGVSMQALRDWERSGVPFRSRKQAENVCNARGFDVNTLWDKKIKRLSGNDIEHQFHLFLRSNPPAEDVELLAQTLTLLRRRAANAK